MPGSSPLPLVSLHGQINKPGHRGAQGAWSSPRAPVLLFSRSLALPSSHGLLLALPRGRASGHSGCSVPRRRRPSESRGHGGRRSGARLALSGRAPLPAGSSGPPVPLSPWAVTAALWVQDRRRVRVKLAPGKRRRQHGLCPLSPGPSEVARTALPLCLLSPAPGPRLPPPTRGQPVSARRLAVLKRLRRRLVLIPALSERGLTHSGITPGASSSSLGGPAASEGTGQAPPLAWRLRRGGRACAEHPRAGAGLGSGERGGEAAAGLGCGVGERGASLGEGLCVPPTPPSESSAQDPRGAPTTPAALLGTPAAPSFSGVPGSAARGWLAGVSRLTVCLSARGYRCLQCPVKKKKIKPENNLNVPLTGNEKEGKGAMLGASFLSFFALLYS